MDNNGLRPTLASMTGFARSQGEVLGDGTILAWIWELRSVNGRGLDVKLRVPGGLDMLEPVFREEAAKLLKRGNVSGTLTLKRESAGGLMPDLAALERVKTLAIDLADSIPGALPPRAELLLALPGVLRQANPLDDSEELQSALRDAVSLGFMQTLDGLAAARAAEGARLAEIIAARIDEIEQLHGQAAQQAGTQRELHMARLMDQLQALLAAAPALPEERIAQEVALLATKSDVTEELDRLKSHIEAARGLLDEAAGIGRRLEFLVQEFNREANTLCSKSVSLPLTTTGLKLKAAIEQLREQAANVE
jgi:uncharacterized protein (TIGR00255 family)